MAVERLRMGLPRLGAGITLALLAIGLFLTIEISLVIKHDQDSPLFPEGGSVYQCAKAMHASPGSDFYCPSMGPLTGAVIRIQQTGPFWRTFTARTDARGFFTVNLPAGHYS